MTKQMIALSQVVTEEVIRVNLSNDEIAERKDVVSREMLLMEDLQRQLKDLTKSYNERIKAKKQNVAMNLTEIRAGYVDKVMKVHNIPNDKNKTIEFYDDNGVLVGSRMMTREERPSIEFEPVNND